MSTHLTVDVAIVGAGPAGIAAAVRAGETGARVALVDEGLLPGGQIWRAGPGWRPPRAASAWIQRLEGLAILGLSQCSVVDAARASDGFVLTGELRGEARVVRARSLVLATGARERWIPFPGWTLPGVVGVGGAQALLKAGTDVAGKRVVVAGTGPLLLPVAAALRATGARVLLVAEQAPARAVRGFALGLWRRPSALVQAARYRAGFLGTPYRTGTWVTEATGESTVRAVTVTNGRTTRTIACDLLCVGYGLVPNTELARLLGCRTEQGGVVVDANQETSVPGVFCAGEPTGVGGVDLALVEGEIAGLAAVDRAERAAPLHARRAALRDMAAAMERAFAPRDELRRVAAPDTVVCRCEDVTLGALAPHWSSRQAKLYTRAGMGPCQGRVCGAALEFLHGWRADTVRLPVAPALLSTLLAEPREGAATRDPRSSGA